MAPGDVSRVSIVTLGVRTPIPDPSPIEGEGRPPMTDAAVLASGKGHTDENFPVASWVLHPRHRAPIMAFYRFARVADDVADHPTASANEKLALLAAMQAGLTGADGVSPEGEGLRRALIADDLTDQ